jgi:hypothetical protein
VKVDMTGSSPEIADIYGCGYCGSPSCLMHYGRSIGICPFADRKEGWNLESIKSLSSELSGLQRGRPFIQEVEPCAEKDTFTIEGIYRDPVDEGISALFHERSLGRIMGSRPFTSVKWSPQLGYGMGTTEDGTRVHVHTRGKVIIRKSTTRDGAEKMWRSITSAVKPALFSTRKGFVLWEALYFCYHNGSDYPFVRDFLRWYDQSGDASVILDSSRETFKNIDENDGEKLRNDVIDALLTSDATSEITAKLSSLREASKTEWRRREKDGFGSDLLADRIHYLRSHRAFDGLISFIGMDGEEDINPISDLFSFMNDIWKGIDVNNDISSLSLEQLDGMKGLMKAIYFLTPVSLRLHPIYTSKSNP